MRKKLLALILTLACAVTLLPGLATAAEQDPSLAADDLPVYQTGDFGFDVDISANAVILLNLDTNTIVFERNADTRLHPASTTKIMSVALAMELCDDLDGTIVTVPDGVWNEFQGLDVSHANLKAGEQLSMNALLHCMMVQSANEAAVALAAYYGRDDFMRMMNEKATELGCTDTHFSNPHGAFVANHYTTARDMLLITQWALSIPGFFEMSQLARYYKEPSNLSEGVTLVTTNYMQDPYSKYYTPYIHGVKTGTMNTSGRCLISVAEQDGARYLSLVFGCPMENTDRIWEDGVSSFTDTRLICDWAFDNLALVNVVNSDTAVAEIRLRYAAGRDALLLYPDGELLAVTNRGDEPLEIRYEYDLPERINAPIEAGDVIGAADVYYGERLIGRVNLVSREYIGRNGFVMVMDTLGDILTSTPAKIIYIILLLFVLFYLYYMLVLVPRAQKKKKRRKR